MSIPFYAKSKTNQGYIKNMEVLSYHDLNGVMAFQMGMHKTVDERYYLYCGSFKGAGITILEVTDPADPRFIDYFEVCDPAKYRKQSTPKVQVADGRLVVALGGGIPYLHGCEWEDKNISGINIYSIEDPERPRLLSHWETGFEGGMGVTALCTTGPVSLSDCRLSDISRRFFVFWTSPIHQSQEVGRWWKPEQFADGQISEPTPWVIWTRKAGLIFTVPPMYGRNSLLWLLDWRRRNFGCTGCDSPQLLGQLMVQPPFSGKELVLVATPFSP